jgi:conjugal transfer pilus assembly protein TraW
MRALALGLTLLTGSVTAADLGTWGDLWPVAEPDMLTVIESRLQTLAQSGEMDKKMAEFKARVVRNSQRPPAVEGITRAVRYERRWFDRACGWTRRLPTTGQRVCSGGAGL